MTDAAAMTRAVHTLPLYLVEEIGDGDTITVLLDMGADVLRRTRLRLVTVDCPERNQVWRWSAAREYTALWLQQRTAKKLKVDLQLTRQGRYVETFGRYLADVYTPDGESLSSALLQSEHAELWTRS